MAITRHAAKFLLEVGKSAVMLIRHHAAADEIMISS
jgi:hypothetical protein